MIRTYTSVSRYIQGPGALDRLGTESLTWGKTPLVITDDILRDLLGDRVRASFDSARVPLNLFTFPGEVTRPTIDRLADDARKLDADVIIGMGGGKALDTAKGVALALGCAMISVPTIAATDAPASFAIAVYDDHHFLSEILKLPRNPDLVLVDTKIICDAPARFLIAGIGDAISKKFEAEACLKAGAEMLMGGPSTHTGQALATACYQLIRDHAVPALAAARRGEPDDHLEALLEATVLLSTLGFENGGLSVSHAIAKGIPLVERAARSLHGEHVAYGLLVQLVLEERKPEFIDELRRFYRQVGLPLQLAAMGMQSVRDDEIRTIADNAMTSPSLKRFHRVLTVEELVAAIRRIEAMATSDD